MNLITIRSSFMPIPAAGSKIIRRCNDGFPLSIKTVFFGFMVLLGPVSLGVFNAMFRSCSYISLGKSVLASSMIQSLKRQTGVTVLYYFCGSLSSEGSEVSVVLRCLIAQLIRNDRALSSYVHEEYIGKGCSPTTARLKALICRLLSGVKESRICIDGVDECADKDQNQILGALLPLVQSTTMATGACCKILFTSRDIRSISRYLKKHPTVALNEERRSVDAAIDAFIHDKLQAFRNEIENVGQQQDLVDGVERELVSRAEGLN